MYIMLSVTSFIYIYIYAHARVRMYVYVCVCVCMHAYNKTEYERAGLTLTCVDILWVHRCNQLHIWDS